MFVNHPYHHSNHSIMKSISTLFLLSICSIAFGQSPAVTSWLQNATIKGSHYVNGNSVAIADTALANIRTVSYSSNWVYVKTNGVPTYTTGPFLDGNPSLTTAQNALFKISLNPVKNTGTQSPTTGGNIGLFINGVALFDYRDGVSWSNANNALKGGPLGGMGDNVWNRDAVVAEKNGFDCSKGHPAMGNYHHHQNPSAFKLDHKVISNICNLYDADGLYAIDTNKHSPLIGFAYDGFPIYGAYAFKNTNGSGAITRMKSGYKVRNISVRNQYANGNTVTQGPNVSSTYPLGYFREDYAFIADTASDVLDANNGRFCVTPEYPSGIYCYFATVDANWNSAYPYAVGPYFYGVKTASKVNSITEAVTQYKPNNTQVNMALEAFQCLLFPNPANSTLAVQYQGLLNQEVQLKLYDLNAQLIDSKWIKQGSTIAYFDVESLYAGVYVLQIESGQSIVTKRIEIAH